MNFLISGKLGDFIHMLYVVKYFYLNNNSINLFYHPCFLEGLDLYKSFDNLKPLVEKQSYIDSFSIYNNELIDINLSDFRYNLNINNFGWTDFLINTFRIKKLDYLSWIESDLNDKYKGKAVIHRSLKNQNPNFPWEEVLKKYKEKLIFVSIDENEYNLFQYNKDIEFIKADNMYDLSVIINSSDLFIGNQSMPFALASALNKNRILEVNKNEQQLRENHRWYMDECKYYDNLHYYWNDEINNLTI